MTRALDRVAAWCRATFGMIDIPSALQLVLGEWESESSTHRRGYVRREICAICRGAIHDTGEMCPEQKVADCAICGPVLLDYYGCPGGGVNHHPTNIRPVTEWQWRALVREQRIKRRLRYQR